MDQKQIEDYLFKIMSIWKSVSKENSNDVSAYNYISFNVLSLHMMAVSLKEHYAEIIENDNEARIKFAKLHKSLCNIVSSLNHKFKIDEDKEHIDDILKYVLKIKEDIEVIKLHYKLSTT
jgi:hypothetical protein